jgi:hypothetical protein
VIPIGTEGAALAESLPRQRQATSAPLADRVGYVAAREPVKGGDPLLGEIL